MDKAILTCALTGVLTDPKRHPVPVTPGQMAREARDAFNAGATIMHVHLRRQEPGMGHLPSWDTDLADAIVGAIRDACPGVIVNLSTGVIGADISGPAACLRRVRPEIAACNAGSLNYLKLKDDGTWAWPPVVFDNPVAKIGRFIDVMRECGAQPEFECFDVGIVRSVALYAKGGVLSAFAGPVEYNFVMGVASGMPCDIDLLGFLPRYLVEGAIWQTTLIGRREIWPVHQKTAEMGGMLRTGLEDTFYLPDGERAGGNGALVQALAACVERTGRSVATPIEARGILGLHA